jgi:hypothetical protein
MDGPRPTNAVKQQLQANTAAKSDIGHRVIVVGVQRLHSCAHEAVVASIEREPDYPATHAVWMAELLGDTCHESAPAGHLLTVPAHVFDTHTIGGPDEQAPARQPRLGRGSVARRRWRHRRRQGDYCAANGHAVFGAKVPRQFNTLGLVSVVVQRTGDVCAIFTRPL